jgi:tetratricopeptide (TPR) repeat protein
LKANTQLLLVLVLACAFAPGDVFADPAAPQGEVLSTEGSVGFAHAAAPWTPAKSGQTLVVQDRVNTQANSRAMLQLAELGRLRLDQLTTLEVLPPREKASKATLDLKTGAMYFFTRERPREFQVQTPFALAASRGTELLVAVGANGHTTFTVFDGEVVVTNTLGFVVLNTGDVGAVDPGTAPVKTAVIQAVNLVQWWLYYPGILDPNELVLAPGERTLLADSLKDYRAGDLLAAVADYPPGRTPQSQSERIYLASLLLAVGQVDRAEAQLAGVDSSSSLSTALRELIAAITFQPGTPTNNSPASTTEWLARSYVQQSRHDLSGALASARAAAARNPNFGFAWERVAELEFGFGRREQALSALSQALDDSPRNAQAWALKGFLAAAGNRFTEAANAFNRAIELDGALGNGWLGRGLVRIHQGDAEGGRADLQTAAAMEPDRSLLRSYLGKAFDNSGDVTNAERELALAKRLDSHDPTPWFYSALLLREQLRYNDSVRDLEESSDLNDNRSVYRSRLLLDQDQAVRSASLATIYQDVGMDEVSVREAARAASLDYANPSSHLFLSDSFNALRDPTDYVLRYDTAWLSELLLANLLAPVGAGTLSRDVSQHEYSRLFSANQLNFSSDAETRTDGEVIELASQSGTYGNTSYSTDLDYRHYDGVRTNNDLSRIEWFSQAKEQLSPQDSIFVLAEYRAYHSGDNFQYYYQTNARPFFEYDESEKPNLLTAYHHEWSPGVHTLFLAGRLQTEQGFADRGTQQFILTQGDGKMPGAVDNPPYFDVNYQSSLAIYTGELNQIFQGDKFNVVCGDRLQIGSFDTTDELALSAAAPPDIVPYFHNPPGAANSESYFERNSVYDYNTIQLIDNLLLTGGVAYDHLIFPDGYRTVPVTSGSMKLDQISPKAAIVWSPLPEIAFRGIFTHSVGGVSDEDDFRLEPSQLAGFNQAYQTLIPESIFGSVDAQAIRTAGAGIDFKFKSGTFFGVQAEFLEADASRSQGIFVLPQPIINPPPPSIYIGSTPEDLTYHENSVVATLNQLFAGGLSSGMQYKITHSEMNDDFPAGPAGFPATDQITHAQLQQVTWFALLNHPSGFFARTEIQWYHQDDYGESPAEPTSDFYQANIYAGWRLRRQHGELRLGVLNLTGANYSENPLNPFVELPRSRVFDARFTMNF